MQGMEEASSRSKAVFTEAWAWREQLQRAMDGCHSTDDMSAYSLAQYEEFEGANIPLPSGYQARALFCQLEHCLLFALQLAWPTCSAHTHTVIPLLS